MHIPEALAKRIRALGEVPEAIYAVRSRKAFLSAGKERVPWFPAASYNGSGYSFDPASAVPVLALNPKPHDQILDMCAAPGTKTILIAHITSNTADITANDISRARVLRLQENVERYGVAARITNVSGRIIDDTFDKVLVDAPCSGEGMVNKKEKLFAHWSERRVHFLAKKQKKLILNAFRILNNGGTLVYSTCTFAPEENEGVMQCLLDRNSNAVLDNIDVSIIHAPGLDAWENRLFSSSMGKCIRIYPQHNGTSGFFVAQVRKQ